MILPVKGAQRRRRGQADRWTDRRAGGQASRGLEAGSRRDRHAEDLSGWTGVVEGRFRRKQRQSIGGNKAHRITSRPVRKGRAISDTPTPPCPPLPPTLSPVQPHAAAKRPASLRVLNFQGTSGCLPTTRARLLRASPRSERIP